MFRISRRTTDCSPTASKYNYTVNVVFVYVFVLLPRRVWTRASV